MGNHRFFEQITTNRNPIVEAENRIINELRANGPDLAITESTALFNNARIPIGERIAAAKDIECKTRGGEDQLVVKPINYNDGRFVTKSEQVSIVENVRNPFGQGQGYCINIANLPYEKYQVAVQQPGYGNRYAGGFTNGYGYGGAGLLGTAFSTGIGLYHGHKHHKHEEQMQQQQQQSLQQQQQFYGYRQF